MRLSKTCVTRSPLTLCLYLTVGCGSTATPTVADCPTGTTCAPALGDDGGPSHAGAGPDSGLAMPASSELNGVPCKVRDVLEARCVSCHATEPVFSAPMALTSLAALHAPSPKDGAKPTYQAVKERINASDPHTRMPPTTSAPLTADQLATLNAWLDTDAAASSETCAADVPDAGPEASGDGGSARDGLTCYKMVAHAAGDLTAPFKVGVSHDTYLTFVFEAPWQGTAYGLLVNPIVHNKKAIHHWLLFQDAAPGIPGSINPTTGAHPSGQLVYGWAPGGEGMDFRKKGDVGLELPHQTYTMEFHYNSDEESALDASGVELCVASEKPANIATQSWLGLDNLTFPSTSWTGTCVPASQEPIHILAVTPHMHKSGIHMKGVINRKGGAKETLHDEDFDFNYQRIYAKDVVLQPGDTITTTCTYSQPQMFGKSTNEEMCYLFTIAYPRNALSDLGVWGAGAHGGNSCLGQ